MYTTNQAILLNFLIQALLHFLHCSMMKFPDGDHIDMAIEVVGKAKDESLTEQLTDYLMGGNDASPKVAYNM